MVDCKVEEILVDKYNMLEIVYQALTIQKEHCRSEKVPKSEIPDTQNTEGGEIPIENFEEGNVLFSRWNTCQCNNFLIHHNLYNRHQRNHIHMSQSQYRKESRQQDKCPQRPHFKINNFLFPFFGSNNSFIFNNHRRRWLQQLVYILSKRKHLI